jgi:thiol-disulfide isomerase/thioredoxin
MRNTLVLAAFLCLRFLVVAADPPLTLLGADQKEHAPLAVGSKKAVVLFFVSPYCPTSNTFVPEMNKIATDYADSFPFFFVHADLDQKYTDILQHTEMNGIKATVLMDNEQRLAKRVGAKTTPETVVLGPEGKTLYQGRINDLYLGPTRRQRQATTKELRDALDAIVDGKPIAVDHTDAAGCKITGLK